MQAQAIIKDLADALYEANSLISAVVDARLLPRGYNKEWTDRDGNRCTAGCMNAESAEEIRDRVRKALAQWEAC